MEITEVKHFRNKLLFLEGKTGQEIQAEYDKLNNKDSFTLSSNMFRNTDGSYDSFIFFKKKED